MAEEGLSYNINSKVSKSTYDFFQSMATELDTSVSELVRGILVGIQAGAPTKEDVTNKYNIRTSETP